MNYKKYKNVKIIKDIDSQYALAQTKGFKFKIRKQKIDAFTCDEVFKTGYFKHLEIKENDIIIDIGCNIGVFAVAAATKCQKIIAFEPDKENYNLALENLKLNNINNVVLFNKAVSNYDGEIDLYLNSGVCSDCHSTLKIRGREVVKVKTVDINTIIKEYNPNKLKIDCEGEELVFMQAANMQNIQNLAMEVHFTYSKRDKHKNYYKVLNNIQKYFNNIKYPKVQNNFSKMMFAKK
tara:strand:+ start:2477 stop:3184 length:708 start_codon:yes stop_codon:yes gene_type:complete